MTRPMTNTFTWPWDKWNDYVEYVRADYPAFADQLDAILVSRPGTRPVTITIREDDGVMSATEGKPR